MTLETGQEYGFYKECLGWFLATLKRVEVRDTTVAHKKVTYEVETKDGLVTECTSVQSARSLKDHRLVDFWTKKGEAPKFEGFEDVVKPVIKWLCENVHPHMQIIIDSSGAEMVESIKSIKTLEFLTD